MYTGLVESVHVSRELFPSGENKMEGGGEGVREGGCGGEEGDVRSDLETVLEGVASLSVGEEGEDEKTEEEGEDRKEDGKREVEGEEGEGGEGVKRGEGGGEGSESPSEPQSYLITAPTTPRGKKTTFLLGYSGFTCVQ